MLARSWLRLFEARGCPCKSAVSVVVSQADDQVAVENEVFNRVSVVQTGQHAKRGVSAGLVPTSPA